MSDHSEKRDALSRPAKHPSEDPKPNVGTDPEELPGESGHKQVIPDEKKVKEADRAKKARRERESPEEKAERVKDA